MKAHRDEQGRLHRLDGPAIEDGKGSFVWYKDGLIHRDDGPAVMLVNENGTTEEQFWMEGKQIE